MGTVTIASQPYTVYGDLAAAKLYLAGSIGPGPDAWSALATDDLKSKYIVAAFRYLERQKWDPTAVPDTATRSSLLAFQQAEYEMAAILAADPTPNNSANSGSNVESVKAGPVDVKFFRPTDGTAGSATKMPQVVQDLVGGYLASASSTSVGATAYNSNDPDCTGDFDNDLDSSFTGESEFTRTFGF